MIRRRFLLTAGALPAFAGALAIAPPARAEGLGPGDEGNSLSAVASTTEADAQTARVPHSPDGQYLNYASGRSNIGTGSNVTFDDAGVIMVRRGSGYVHNPVTISQYGLQQFSYWSANGDASARHKAVLQANWLIRNQDPATGRWSYGYPFSVGGMSETLPAGWSSAMAQGQAISLLSRIYRAFPTKGTYRTAALRAKWPLRRSVIEGGLTAQFMGMPHYEEYPTSTPCLALNGFQFTLVGLWDGAQNLDDGEAQQFFDEGWRTMVETLPHYDVVSTSAYHLGHLTKPPRKVHNADHYHRIHVMLLGVLGEMRPHETIEFYRSLWSSYPPME